MSSIIRFEIFWCHLIVWFNNQNVDQNDDISFLYSTLLWINLQDLRLATDKAMDAVTNWPGTIQDGPGLATLETYR